MVEVATQTDEKHDGTIFLEAERVKKIMIQKLRLYRVADYYAYYGNEKPEAELVFDDRESFTNGIHYMLKESPLFKRISFIDPCFAIIMKSLSELWDDMIISGLAGVFVTWRKMIVLKIGNKDTQYKYFIDVRTDEILELVM